MDRDGLPQEEGEWGEIRREHTETGNVPLTRDGTDLLSLPGRHYIRVANP